MESFFEYILLGICYVLTAIEFFGFMILPFCLLGALIYGIYKCLKSQNNDNC